MRRSILCAILWGMLCGVCLAEPPAGVDPSASLKSFIGRQEPDFHWDLAGSQESERGTVWQLHLVSQEWQGTVWEHALQVYQPRQLRFPQHVLLFVTGGRTGGQPKDEDVATGLALAEWCGARVAVLHQVPNQPLLGDHVEDDLITETWLKYLETGDERWPLLFPMVKSAVKAMDAVEQFVAGRGEAPLKGFVITGASKRGWTSWLAPVADPRIIATAPIVINMLNFPAQMDYQIATWGQYSEQIADYTSKGLVRASGEPQSPREQRLWQLMDPYVYRKQLTLPKLMIVGTNDRYWVVDAMNQYWDDLAGPKYTLQVPNVGHNLGNGRELALRTLAVFFRFQAAQQPLPRLGWVLNRPAGELQLEMTADPAPSGVQFWSARSDTADFRDARWTPQPVDFRDGRGSGSVSADPTGHRAVFGEFQYESEGLSYSLTTQSYRD